MFKFFFIKLNLSTVRGLVNISAHWWSVSNFSYTNWRWEKPQEGGVEWCVSKTLVLFCSRTVLRFRVWRSSESEWVQSLVQRIIRIEQRKKEHKQLYRFLPQTGSSLVPLALPRRVPLKCNVRLQVAQSHKKETSLLKDNSKRLPLLNHNWKRLPMLNHNWKRLDLTITKNWIRFWILDIQSEVFTIQCETEQTLFF